MTIAIIGAGISALSAARELRENGKVVKLFEKSRGVGGRMSTRYADQWEFDHGAQYFTIQDESFRANIDQAMHSGVVAPWSSRGLYLHQGVVSADRGRARYVGTPRMNSLPKFWAQDLDIHLGRRVSRVERGGTGLTLSQGITLHFEDGTIESGFEGVISTLPPEQAKAILPADVSALKPLSMAQMHACFTLMIGLSTPLDLGWETLRVKSLPIDWIAINSAKPSRRQDCGTLLVTGEPHWSDKHVEADRDWIKNVMLSAASSLTGLSLQTAPHQVLHRWLYASNKTSPDKAYIGEGDIILCGDWCQGGRVEGAWLSGRAAARSFLSVAP